MSQISLSGNAGGSGTFTIASPNSNNSRTLTLPDNDGTIVTTGGAASLTTSGNLSFTGTGNRITGDFSNATIANRVMFQTTASNTTTAVAALPSGTGISSAWDAFSTNDPNNASFGRMQIVGGTDLRFISSLTGTGTFLPMTFYTGGSERMRLDTSGNVGIGAVPTTRIDFRTSSGFNIGQFVSQLSANPASDDAGETFSLRGNTAVSGVTFSGVDSRLLTFGVDNDNSVYLRASSLSIKASNNLLFKTNGLERARIDSSGNVLVGTTSAAGRITSLVTNGGVALATTNTSGTGLYYGAIFHNNGTTYTSVGSISVSGSATAYNTTSDYRLKNITGPITNSGAYIDSLNPVEGTWKADGSVFVGLIAHEVQEVSRTQVATGVKDGEQMQGMDYSAAEIIANLIAEVKSLRARMAQLEMKGA